MTPKVNGNLYIISLPVIHRSPNPRGGECVILKIILIIRTNSENKKC
jgi:hypothetical protein